MFLKGKNPALVLYVYVIAALTKNRIMVVLNNHMSDAGWCCTPDDGNRLWHTETYKTTHFLQHVDILMQAIYQDSDFVTLGGKPEFVIGFDFRNEQGMVLNDAGTIARLLEGVTPPFWFAGEGENCPFGTDVLRNIGRLFGMSEPSCEELNWAPVAELAGRIVEARSNGEMLVVVPGQFAQLRFPGEKGTSVSSRRGTFFLL